jgi:hypothetical protein
MHTYYTCIRVCICFRSYLCACMHTYYAYIRVCICFLTVDTCTLSSCDCVYACIHTIHTYVYVCIVLLKGFTYASPRLLFVCMHAYMLYCMYYVIQGFYTYKHRSCVCCILRMIIIFCTCICMYVWERLHVWVYVNRNKCTHTYWLIHTDNI